MLGVGYVGRLGLVRHPRAGGGSGGGGGGGGGGSWTPKYLFATNNQLIGTTSYTPTVDMSYIGRSAPCRVSGAPTKLQVLIDNWQLNTGGTREQAGGTLTNTQHWIEVEGVGSQRATFNAATTTTIPGTALLRSDDVLASAFGLSSFSGKTVRVRTGGTVPANTKAVIAMSTNGSSGSIKVYDAAAQGTDPQLQLSGTGALTTPTGGANPTSLALPGVVGIVGYYDQPQRAMIGVGDSIMAFGFLENAADGNGTTDPVIPALVVAKISAQIQEYVADNARTRALMQFANILVDEDMTNDVEVGSRSAAQIWADKQTLHSHFRTASPGGKVMVTRPLPNVAELFFTSVTASGGIATGTLTTKTSATPTALLAAGAAYQIVSIVTAGYNTASVVPTILNGTQIQWPVTAVDGTATLASSSLSAISDSGRSKGTQVPKDQWRDSSGTRDQLMALIASALGAGTIDSYPDTLSAVADATDNHYWATNGTGGNASGTANTAIPGPHPSTAGQQAIGTVIRNAALAIDVTAGSTDTTAPTITSAATGSGPENSAYNVTLTANEGVTFSLRTGADTALFTLVGSTLSLSAKDFELPTDSDANNTYIAYLRAADAAGNPTDFTFTLTVTDIAEGGGGTITPGTVQVDHTFAAATTATDLATLTPATGGAWAAHPATPSAVLDVHTDGHLYNPAVGIAIYANATPITEDRVIATATAFRKSTLGGASRTGIGIKDATADTGIFFGFCSGATYGNTNAWQIQRHTAGANSAIVAEGATSLSTTLTYTIRLTIDWSAGTAVGETSTDGGTTWVTRATMNTGLVKPTSPRLTIREDGSTTAMTATTGFGLKSAKAVAN